MDGMTSTHNDMGAVAQSASQSAPAPERMNWIQHLFNPTGKSTKIQFTRVWTICFFLQLLIIILPFFIGFVMSLAGGDPTGLTTFGVYATPIVFIVTTFFSFVVHSRRLIDARKWSFLSILVLIPLFAALALFSMSIAGSSAQYDGLYEKRSEFLADPQAWRAERLAERKAKQDRTVAFRAFNSEAKPLFWDPFVGGENELQATAAATFERLRESARELVPPKPEIGAEGGEGAEGGQASPQRRGGQGRGQGGGNGARPDQPLPSKVDFILKPNVGTIQMVMIPLSFLVMLWSLLWLARKPSALSRREQEAANSAPGAFG